MWLCVYYLGVDQFDELGIFSSVLHGGEASLAGLLPTKFAASFYVALCFFHSKVRFLCGFVFIIWEWINLVNWGLPIFSSVIYVGEASLGGLLPTKFAASSRVFKNLSFELLNFCFSHSKVALCLLFGTGSI
jgi:hypothetical protein